MKVEDNIRHFAYFLLAYVLKYARNAQQQKPYVFELIKPL